MSTIAAVRCARILAVSNIREKHGVQEFISTDLSIRRGLCPGYK